MRTLKIDGDGYVALVRCDKWHSGNTRFVREGDYCVCQGCGNYVPVAHCITRQTELEAFNAGYSEEARQS